MQIVIARSRRFLIYVLSIALAVCAIGFSGGTFGHVQAGDASLAFVGNLIGTFHDQPWIWLDPTYSHCF